MFRKRKKPDPIARGTEEKKMKKIMENKLNMVVGGSMEDVTEDSDALYRKGFLDCEYGNGELIFHWVEDSAKVDAAWKKALGITCVSKPFYSNQYFKDGKEITHNLAYYMLTGY